MDLSNSQQFKLAVLLEPKRRGDQKKDKKKSRVSNSLDLKTAKTQPTTAMILTQNSLVLHTEELDALETGTFNDRPGIIPCGSSYCRSRTSITKEAKKSDLYKEQTNGFEEKVKKPLGEADMPQFNHFDRETPLRLPGRGKHSMSRRTKTKIRQKIMAWSRVSTHRQVKFVFVTLTLTSPQIGTDKDYTRMLNTWLTYVRKYCGVKNYIFVNEIQKKSTNNLHTHIILDRFMPIGLINRSWCKILKDNGYTFTPTKGENAGIAGTDFTKANPVDVDVVYNLDRVPGYITKYVTKNDCEMDCAIWNCSNTISRLFTSVKIYQKEVFSSLFSAFHKVLTAKLDNGDTLHIHLLSQYTGIQKSAFRINEGVLDETLTKEKFFKTNKTNPMRLKQITGVTEFSDLAILQSFSHLLIVKNGAAAITDELISVSIKTAGSGSTPVCNRSKG